MNSVLRSRSRPDDMKTRQAGRVVQPNGGRNTNRHGDDRRQSRVKCRCLDDGVMNTGLVPLRCPAGRNRRVLLGISRWD